MVTGSVTINASPSSAELGDRITFTGRLLIDGIPSPAGITIYLDAAPASPVTLASGDADSSGNYDIDWRANYTGNLPIYAHAAAYQGFNSRTITVRITEPEPEPEPGFTFTVTDQTTGQPLQGANCSLRAALNCTGDAVTGLTDASGIAVLSAVWFVPRSWGVSKAGYTPLCSNDVDAQLTAALEPLPILLPNPQIKNVTFPPTVTPGQEVTITWTVENQGETTPHVQWTRLRDADTDELFLDFTFNLAAGGQTGAVAVLFMPDRTWNLRIDAGYETTLTASRSLKLGNGQSIILPVAAIGLIAYILFYKK